MHSPRPRPQAIKLSCRKPLLWFLPYSYDAFKQLLLRLRFFSDGLLVHTIASSMAGLVAALASTPVDRAKTLLMTDRQAHGTVIACLVKIARSKGLAGLYQGFLATWMRLGPWAFLFFVCPSANGSN